MSARSALPLLTAPQAYDSINEQQVRSSIEDRLGQVETSINALDTSVSALDASIAGLDYVVGPASATANAIALFNGTTGDLIKDSTYAITAAGAALIDDADAAAQRATLGLGAIATQGDGDKGDITVSASGATWAVDANAVTYAKLQDASAGNVVLTRANAAAGDYGETALAASQLVGRGSAGNVASITLGSGLSMSGDTLSNTAGLLLLTSGTVSAAATLDIVLTAYTAYRGIVFELYNFTPATDDVELWMRLSTDGGATYDAGAGAYKWGLNGGADGTAIAQGSSSDTKLGIAFHATGTSAVSNVAAEGGATSRVTLMSQTDATKWPRVSWSSSWIGASLVNLYGQGHGARLVAQDTDAVRFVFEAGNIASGSYAVYGIQ